jgi:hypothetical protein
MARSQSPQAAGSVRRRSRAWPDPRGLGGEKPGRPIPESTSATAVAPGPVYWASALRARLAAGESGDARQLPQAERPDAVVGPAGRQAG